MVLDFIPQGDPVLAEMFAKFGILPEPSRIVDIDILSTALNAAGLAPGERIVKLSCRHSALSKNRKKMVCPRCEQLMRHGMDYDSWIRGVTEGYDGMHWREDPVRFLNERTDLEGTFIEDDED